VVDENDAGLETAVSLSGMLGYLNFSGGQKAPLGGARPLPRKRLKQPLTPSNAVHCASPKRI
jgi:hypothetical protein